MTAEICLGHICLSEKGYLIVPGNDLPAVRVDGSRIDIIRQGRFVLEGTEELNEALDEADDGAAGLDCE